MITKIKQHKLSSPGGLIDRLPSGNGRRVLISLVLMGLSAVGAAALFAQETSEPKTLAEQSLSSNRVTFSVTPVVKGEGGIDFDISMNTHSVNLDFVMTEIAAIVVDGGDPVQAVAWKGDAAGGHHRSGTLTFPYELEEIGDIKLLIKPEGRRFKELIFEWDV